MSKTSTESTEKKLSAKEMVTEALTQLNERSGSSLSAIKKYILEKHPNVLIDNYSTQIKRFIVDSLKKGSMVKTTGPPTSINGEFFDYFLIEHSHVRNNLTKFRVFWIFFMPLEVFNS